MAVNRKDAPPIWTRPAPGTRKPRFTREQIAAAALAIADREGFEAVSMRRIAEELGAATMTLYHYVRTKEDLIALMDDSIMGEVLVSDADLAGGWRHALAMIARSSRDAFLRHPWALYALRSARFGPNGMRHVEQSMAAVADAPLDDVHKVMLLGVVDDFVFGHVMRAQAAWRTDAEGPKSATSEQIAAFMHQMLSSGEFPHLSRLIGSKSSLEVGQHMAQTMTADETFELGLSALLDIGTRGSEQRSAAKATAPKAAHGKATAPKAGAPKRGRDQKA